MLGKTALFRSWLGRGPSCGIETSLEKRKKKNLREIVKTKAESGLPRKRQDTQQGWGEKLGWCLRRKLGEMSVFLKLPCPENVSTNTQPNFTAYNSGTTDQKQRSSLLREKHLNWVKNILTSQQSKMLTSQRVSLDETSSISLRVGGVGFFLKHYLNQHVGVEGGEDWPLVGNMHFIF